MTEMRDCLVCGESVPLIGPNLPVSGQHDGCLERCGVCGEPDDRYCSCGTFVSFEDMALADMKGYLARGGLSLDVK